MITAQGIYDLPHDEYHRDPVPGGSLSSSGAWTIAMDCPAVFKHQRENPKHKRVFDIGTASHLMTLEPELFAEQVVIVRGVTKKGAPSAGYTTDDAIAQRDAAYAEGKTPLLPQEFELVRAMRDVLLQHPIGRVAFINGKAEQSIFWRDPEFGIWCRTRPDWIPTNPRYVINWKSAASVRPDDIAKAIRNMGYFAKSAWEMDGIEAVTGTRPETFYLLFQSKEPPHLIVNVPLHPEDLEWGQIINRKARGLYAWCAERNEWPGYQPDITKAPTAFEIRMPEWALFDLDRRHKAGEFEPPQMMETVG